MRLQKSDHSAPCERGRRCSRYADAACGTITRQPDIDHCTRSPSAAEAGRLLIINAADLDSIRSSARPPTPVPARASPRRPSPVRTVSPAPSRHPSASTLPLGAPDGQSPVSVERSPLLDASGTRRSKRHAARSRGADVGRHPRRRIRVSMIRGSKSDGYLAVLGTRVDGPTSIRPGPG